jgi:hypothetical protein|tara:strand:- start:33 stop:317 length:285 start_codon:yes stop_codon:yes gene_type:complete
MADEQGIIASLIESIGDALKRDELEAPNNDLSTRIINGRKYVVRGAKRDKNGRLTGGIILDRAGSEEKTGESIASQIGFKRGGSIKLKNFKGTF